MGVSQATGEKTGELKFTTVLTPTAHGSVKITAVAPFLLTLTAEDGTVFTFDLQTLTFT